MSIRTCLLAACVSVLAFGGIAAQSNQVATNSTTPTSVDSAPATTLQPGDIIRLRIWREPDLSGDVQVDERGDAMFPKIGSQHVEAMSSDSLRAMLVTLYAETLRQPSIDVTFLRRVTVFGAVKNPGVYSVDPTMTVSDVFALAGGNTKDGQPDKFELRRNGEHVDVQLSEHTVVGRSPIRSGDELYVPERSWFSRNSGIVVAAVISGAAFITAAFIH